MDLKDFKISARLALIGKRKESGFAVKEVTLKGFLLEWLFKVVFKQKAIGR